MPDVSFGSLWGIAGRLLDLFKQKLYIYVEVSFGANKPYALTLVNRSAFTLEVNSLEVEPDGFPSAGNGWQLNHAGLFKEQRLLPGQRIRFLFEAPHIASIPVRRFSVRYSSCIFDKRIPRSNQIAEYNFDESRNTVSVTASVSLGTRSAGPDSQD